MSGGTAMLEAFLAALAGRTGRGAADRVSPDGDIDFCRRSAALVGAL